MDFCYLDGGNGREHNAVGFVEIYKIFVTQDAHFSGTD